MTTTVITDVGINAAINAGTGGPVITVDSFKIGSTLITPARTMTDVTSLVYTGTSAQIQYQVVSQSDIIFSVTIDETVGDFSVGNIGLFLTDGSMFTISTLPAVATKIKTALPTIGNKMKFNILVHMDGIATITNLTVITAAEAALPEVTVETLLPGAAVAPYPVYLVRNYNGTGVPALASRVGGNWYYYPSATTVTTSPNPTGQTFDAAVNDLDVVYNNAGTWYQGDGTDITKGGYAIKSTLGEVVMNGELDGFAGLTAGSEYYASTFGGLTTTPNNFFIGEAMSATKLMVRAEWRPVDFTDEFYVDASDLAGTVAVNNVVYFNTSTGLWSLADGTDNSKGAQAILLPNNELKTSGIFKHTTLTPFVTGTKYYANATGGFTTTPNEWYVGKAISTSELILGVSDGYSINSSINYGAIKGVTLGAGVVAGSVVYNNSGTYDLGDGTDDSKGGYGVIDDSLGLLLNGVYDGYAGLTIGANYYASATGSITTIPNSWFIGTAVNATTLHIRAEYRPDDTSDEVYVDAADLTVGVVVDNVVYYNSGTSKWALADGTDDAKGAYAIVLPNNELKSSGVYKHTSLTPFVVGSDYYANATGGFTTTPNNWYIGRAISTSELLLGVGSGLAVANTTKYGTVEGITLGVGVVPGSVVYNNSGTYDLADGTDSTKGGYGIIDSQNRLLLNGAYDAYVGLTVGAEYYAGTAGALTTTANEFFIGEAVSATTLHVRAEKRGGSALTGQTLDGTVAVRDVVYHDGTNWKRGDGTDSTKGGFGIADSTSSVVINGIIDGYAGLTAGVEYFAGTTGGLTTTVNPYFIGVALSATKLLVRAERRNNGTIDFQVMDAGVAVRDTVYHDGTNWKQGDGTDNSKGGFGIALSTTRVMLNGIVTGYLGLTPGADYFAGVGGTIVTTPNPYFIGVALNATTLLVRAEQRNSSAIINQTINAGVSIRDVVYHDGTDWKQGDGLDMNKGGYGINSAANEVTLNGLISGYAGLTAGAEYYAGTLGTITTTPNPYFIGVAISATELLVRAERRGASTITGQTLDGAVAIREVVYFDGTNWKEADGINLTKGGFGVATSTSEITMNGVVTGYAGLTPGASYYAGLAGALTTSKNKHFIGVALNATTLLVRAEQRVITDANYASQTFDVGVAVRDTVYHDGTNWKQGDGSTPLKGVEGVRGNSGDEVVTSGIVSGYAGLTPGATYYGTTTGGITTTIGQYIVGVAISATELAVNIQDTRILCDDVTITIGTDIATLDLAQVFVENYRIQMETNVVLQLPSGVTTPTQSIRGHIDAGLIIKGASIVGAFPVIADISGTTTAATTLTALQAKVPSTIDCTTALLGVDISKGKQVELTNIIFNGGTNGIIAQYGGKITINSCITHNNTIGVYAIYEGNIICSNIITSWCLSGGVQAWNLSYISLGLAPIVYNCSNSATSAFVGSAISAVNININSKDVACLAGVQSALGSSVNLDTPSFTFQVGSTSIGLLCTDQSYIYANFLTQNQGTYCLYAVTNASIRARNVSYLSGFILSAVLAEKAGYIDCADSTFQGVISAQFAGRVLASGVVAGGFSPAVNTYGNVDGFIIF